MTIQEVKEIIVTIYNFMMDEMLFHDCFTTDDHVQAMTPFLEPLIEDIGKRGKEVEEVLNLIWNEKI